MSSGRSRVALALLFALASSGAGCAVIMQQPPKPDRAPGEVPVCSTGRGGVALDGILAALLGAGALAALAGDEPGVGVGLGAVGGLYTWSAVTGYRSASACEAALADYRIETAARRVAPAPAPTPPAAGGDRPLGPPIEEAAAAAPEAPPEAEPAEEPPPPAAEEPQPAAQGEWSDFWVEVTK
ncbi:MAG TPA: hypothetical protein VFU21_24400 [Kofleriaceae bacterium]|nr:hypothetical protein [Kofleriaceae bacterium]